MTEETFEFTGTITCRVKSIEEVDKEACANPDWERAWQVWFDEGIPSVFTSLAEETAKRAVSAKYNVPVEKLKAESCRGIYSAFVDVLMY